MANVTGRDSFIIAEALAFAYAAMKHLPRLFQTESNMADLRKILFSRCASPEAELGKAMLTAWNLRPDAPPSAGKNFEEFRENLRRIREQVLQGPPDRDRKIFVQYLDTSISFCPDEAVAAEPGEA